MNRVEGGIFVPLSPAQHREVLALLQARGFPPTGQGVAEFLRYLVRKPVPGRGDLLRDVGEWIAQNPEVVQTVRDVARAALLGRLRR